MFNESEAAVTAAKTDAACSLPRVPSDDDPLDAILQSSAGHNALARLEAEALTGSGDSASELDAFLQTSTGHDALERLETEALRAR